MILALLSALFIGICLGLLGSGGSILTIPVLIFILDRPEKEAVAESLAIVALIAFFASFPYAIRSQIHWKTVFLFGLPGMLGAYIGAYTSCYIPSSIQLIIFACFMLFAATFMLSSLKFCNRFSPANYSTGLTMTGGFIIGCLTGLIGVGGGFLIVPTLSLLCRLPLLFCVGTSLVIIFMNSTVGFFKQLEVINALQLSISWTTVEMISIAGIIGSLIGSLIAKNISQQILRKIFGASILILGVFILVSQI